MKRMSPREFQAELSKIVNSLKAYKPQKVILFGSFARGDYNALSDVDLLIVKETERNFIDRIGDILAVCDYEIPIEPLVYTPEELERMQKRGNSFVQTVLEEGIIVYEQQ